MLSRVKHGATIQAVRKAVGAHAYPMSPRTPPHPLTVALVKQITKIAKAKGLSQAQLAESISMLPTQWSGLLNGRQGISDRRLHDAAAKVGAVLVLADTTTDRPAFMGRATREGRVLMCGTDTLPAFIEVEESCAEYLPGDEVIIVEGGYRDGERLLVDTPSGLLLVDALERRGEAKLRTLLGEVLDFDPALHRVVGVVDSFRRRRRK